jgi:hypothetical protein
MSTIDFADKFLFKPMKIPKGYWWRGPEGYYTG